MSLDVTLFIPTFWGDHEVYDRNITHNLNKMADAAGIYKEVWRPEELGIKHAFALVAPLQEGITRLRAKPDFFKTFEPANKWGTYEGFLAFLEEYLAACRRRPDAEVKVSR